MSDNLEDLELNATVVAQAEIDLVQRFVSLIDMEVEQPGPILVLRALARATAIIIQTAPDQETQELAREAFRSYFNVCCLTKHNIKHVHVHTKGHA